MRKTKILTLIVALACSPFAFAQAYLSFHGGMNSAELTGTPVALGHFAIGRGLIVGASFDQDVSKKDIVHLSIQPSLIQHNYKFIHADTSVGYDRDSLHIKGNFFMVPVGLKISALNERFYAFGGLEISVPIVYKAYGKHEVIDLIKGVNSYYVAALFGAGVRFKLKNSTLFVEAKYSQGLTNLAIENSELTNYIPRIRVKSTRIIAGIQILLKRPDKKSN